MMTGNRKYVKIILTRSSVPVSLCHDGQTYELCVIIFTALTFNSWILFSAAFLIEFKPDVFKVFISFYLQYFIDGSSCAAASHVNSFISSDPCGPEVFSPVAMVIKRLLPTRPRFFFIF